MSLSTETLLGVYQSMIPHDTFLLNLFFPNVVTFDTSEIDFDVLIEDHTLAPFVSPMVAGKPHIQKGSQRRKLKPAYVKPKDVVDPEHVLKRRHGERPGGSLTAQQRADAIRVDILMNQRKRIMARMEWMAAQLLRTGKIVISGEDYPEVEVDFGRHADNTDALTGGARWSESATRTPNDDIEDWMALLNAPCTHIIFGKNAWKNYAADDSTKDLINDRRGSDTKLAMEPAQMLASFKGRLGAAGPELWTYSGWYHDESGAKQTYIAENEVVLASTAAGGTRAHGAILDAEAGYRALEIFPKNWVEKDPSVEYLMSQSAPLPVIPLIDSTMKVQVQDAA
jgi:hypothetical protein